MEMGSGFLTQSSGNSNASSSSSSDSLNGLKFGQKIYFENAGSSGSGSGPGASNPKSAPAGSSGSRKVHGGQQQPPRCQVEGCKVDLSDAKAYYSRHKVCGMHSKSPKVIVAGLEQRFCQQCSRFHQLPEFDQGKRSCRRRLAGHNERRRKPPPGSVLSSRYSRFSSTIFDNSSRAGGFLVNFSAYSRLPGRDAWPTARSSERVSGNQTTSTGRIISHPWQNSSQNPPSNLYLQGSASGPGYSRSEIPSGECFTGVSITDLSCALSLLSNQSQGSQNRASGLGAKDLVNTQGVSTAQSTAPHGAVVNQFLNPSWGGFKGSEAGSSSHEICPDLGLGQMSHPFDSHFSSELELSQHSRRQYMELDHSRACDMELDHSRACDSSTQHMHWSL